MDLSEGRLRNELLLLFLVLLHETHEKSVRCCSKQCYVFFSFFLRFGSDFGGFTVPN